MDGILGGGDVAAQLLGAGFRQAGLQALQAAHDAGEQIVEVMRDAAGELADRFHFLCLAQAFLGLAQGRGALADA